MNRNRARRCGSWSNFARHGLSPVVELMEARQLLSSWVVTNSGDIPVIGMLTLREAIEDANSSNDATNSITFDPSIDVIEPLSALPAIQKQVTIDGLSGRTQRVTLDGTNVPEGQPANGLAIQANGVQIQGLVIGNFNGNGIEVSASNVTIANNYIGIDATGTKIAPNALDGVHAVDAQSLVIGSETAMFQNNTLTQPSNVISGNVGSGIYLYGCGGARLTNNVVGSAPDGGNPPALATEWMVLRLNSQTITIRIRGRRFPETLLNLMLI